MTRKIPFVALFLALLGTLALLLLAALQWVAPVYAVETRPVEPLAPTAPADTDMKFSVTAARLGVVELLVPEGHRIDTYVMNVLPADGTPIQTLRACERLDNDGIPGERARWCWDKAEGEMRIRDDGTEGFRDYVAANASLVADWIWLVGNEPDWIDQDNLTPAQYATFFGTIASIMMEELETTAPRLVFCQALSPEAFDYARGTTYCRYAYDEYVAMVAAGAFPQWPEGVSAADTIHALGVHAYARFLGPDLMARNLDATIQDWRDRLQDFVDWSDEVGLGDKPRWITEIGFGAAWCHTTLALGDGPGIGCPGLAERRDGDPYNDYVFYGRHQHEGIWGLQDRMIAYLVNQDDWDAIWWFNAQMRYNHLGECERTMWLMGGEIDCREPGVFDQMSPAGETYASTLNCYLLGIDCPAPIIGDRYFVSGDQPGSAGTLPTEPGDIVSYDLHFDIWRHEFSLSQVGIENNDISAFQYRGDGDFLFALREEAQLPEPIGRVTPSDLLYYLAAEDKLILIFDGSEAGLDGPDEAIDALATIFGNELLISTRGSFQVPGLSGRGEDVIHLVAGTWSMYFDGSDLRLHLAPERNVNGLWIDRPGSGEIHLTTVGSFTEFGQTFAQSAIAVCGGETTGWSTSCTPSESGVAWDGADHGFTAGSVDGLSFVASEWNLWEP